MPRIIATKLMEVSLWFGPNVVLFIQRERERERYKLEYIKPVTPHLIQEKKKKAKSL